MLDIEEKDVLIPEGVLIPCPKVGFAAKKASNCHLCSFYGGLGIMTIDEADFHRKYALRCSHVVERRMTVIAE